MIAKFSRNEIGTTLVEITSETTDTRRVKRDRDKLDIISTPSSAPQMTNFIEGHDP